MPLSGCFSFLPDRKGRPCVFVCYTWVPPYQVTLMDIIAFWVNRKDSIFLLYLFTLHSDQSSSSSPSLPHIVLPPRLPFSEKGDTPTGYQLTLAHQVSAGLGTSSPTEAQQKQLCSGWATMPSYFSAFSSFFPKSTFSSRDQYVLDINSAAPALDSINTHSGLVKLCLLSILVALTLKWGYVEYRARR